MGKVNAVLVYNDCCPFCRDLAFKVRDWVGNENLEIAANNKFDCQSIGLSKEAFEKDVHLILYEDKKFLCFSCGLAIIKAVELNPRFESIAKLYYNSGLFRWTFDKGYFLLKRSKGLINRIFYND